MDFAHNNEITSENSDEDDYTGYCEYLFILIFYKQFE